MYILENKNSRCFSSSMSAPFLLYTVFMLNCGRIRCKHCSHAQKAVSNISSLSDNKWENVPETERPVIIIDQCTN